MCSATNFNLFKNINASLDKSLNGDQESSASPQKATLLTQRLSRDTLDEANLTKSLYENVLTLPERDSYLKYFESAHSPNKTPEPLLSSAGANTGPNFNIDLFLLTQGFYSTIKHLDRSLSDLDRKILLMPDIMQKWIDEESDEDYKMAFTHLRNAFYKYFSTPTNTSMRPDILWIDYQFATKSFYAQQTLKDLSDNLFNTAALNKLTEKLREAGAFAGEKKDFYFWNTEPSNWPDISYQARSVQERRIISLLKSNRHLFSPQYWALGDFTINALPEGYVQPKGNGKYEICVNKMYFFVNDSFNFEGFEGLGLWDLKSGNINIKPDFFLDNTFLFNSDFRNFQRHGYGSYFPVLSRLHKVENFQPQCLEYTYAQ